NRHVLVTRAADQAPPLLEAIEAAGGEALPFPALAIEPADKAEIAAQWSALSRPELVIFVSVNAVRYGLAAIALDETYRLGAIGPATADALRDAGFGAGLVTGDGYDSEALLAAIDAGHDIDGRAVAIVRGDGGREFLGDALTERGATVAYLEVYRRLCPVPEQADIDGLLARWADGGVDATTVLSAATLENLLNLLGESGRALFDRTPVVTPSRGVIQTLEQRGFGSIIERADGPDPDAIVAALARLPAASGRTDETMADNRDTDAGVEQQDETAASDAQAPAAEALTDTQAGEPGADDGAGPERPPDDTAIPRATPERTSGRWRLPAIGAVLLSLVAVAVAGLAVWRTTGDDGPDMAAIESRLDTLERSRSDLDTTVRSGQRAVSDLEAEHRSLAARVTRLSSEASERADLVDSLPGRVQNVETSVAAIEGIAAGTRAHWLRAEAEYYLQLANAQVQLARNPELAVLALTLADERVRALADPVYTPVRRAIAEEIQALRASGGDDTEGVSLTLAGLSQTVSLLPLSSRIETPQTDEQARAEPDDSGAIARGVDSVKRVMGDLVRVRRSDEAVTPLLSPEAAYFLRTNLELKFDVARLALLRGEQQDYEQSLDDAAMWIGEYFDTDDDGVRSALETIADLRQRDVVVELPDVSASLTLLRERTAIDELSEP
ncbi:MAG: uroporphyrinogen-III C-methyltransferase, partial [Pseudomonadota bacterium]